MKENYPKACKEILEILKYMPPNDVEKIPKEMIKAFEYEMDSNYKFEINEDSDFSKLELLDETRAILTNIFRDYWATPKQKEKIIEKQNYSRQKYEDQKKAKYNPDTIFAQKEEENDVKENNLPIEIKKESFIVKLYNFIKNLFVKK